MTRQEFEAKWAALQPDERTNWAVLRVAPDAVYPGPGGDTPALRAAVVEYAIERRGVPDQEQYALALADLVEEGHEYGQQSRGIKYWRLAHASAEMRCRAALMTVLGVET